MGVRQMELVNKFDNALSGIAGDEGETGVAVNSANFARDRVLLGHADLPSRDAPRCTTAAARRSPTIDAASSRTRSSARSPSSPAGHLPAAAGLPAGPALQPARPHQPGRAPRQPAGRSAHAVRPRPHERQGPPDAPRPPRAAAGYPGVLSSHSWSTPDAYPRIYKLGGFVTPYAGDSHGLRRQVAART